MDVVIHLIFIGLCLTEAVSQQNRTNEETLASHLALRKADKLEQDIEENYALDIVIIDSHRTYRGHDGVRESARILKESLPDATFEYGRIRIEGELGYLIWQAKQGEKVTEGVDSFLLKDGMIVGQTIYYHV